MPEDKSGEEDVFTGDWHRFEGRNYACYVLPSTLPTWVPFFSFGVLGSLLGLGMYSWHSRRGGWSVVVYSASRRGNFRTPVVHRKEFGDVGSANLYAEAVDADLSRGKLPSPA